ncbi:hypothetical protein C5L14_23410 [Labrys okinawensis]|uniref:Uncharacterized protein n=1 Tax=Labrys okinawensis TaxID=346911 RepID=A0A2S9Q6J2_9HYPH|nr:hypothetical protein C5L14_23410 [Labrys okinawensis]
MLAQETSITCDFAAPAIFEIDTVLANCGQVGVVAAEEDVVISFHAGGQPLGMKTLRPDPRDQQIFSVAFLRAIS